MVITISSNNGVHPLSVNPGYAKDTEPGFIRYQVSSAVCF